MSVISLRILLASFRGKKLFRMLITRSALLACMVGTSVSQVHSSFALSQHDRQFLGAAAAHLTSHNALGVVVFCFVLSCPSNSLVQQVVGPFSCVLHFMPCIVQCSVAREAWLSGDSKISNIRERNRGINQSL